jgi:hypothetical protein
MNRHQYERYMASDHWKARKDRYFRTHEKRCAACGSVDEVQLHHLSYEKMGREPNDDLMPLCQICHSLVHEYHQAVGGALRAATHHVVQRVSRKLAGPAKRRADVKVGRCNPLDQQLAELRNRRRRKHFAAEGGGK